MPTYGYRCSRGHHWEVVQRMTEAPLTQCPECEAPATRVFYPVGVVFKGQGFYKTDSRGSDSGSIGGGGSDGSGEKDGKSKGEPAKTDTKAKAASDSGGPKADSDGGSKTSSDGGGKSDAPSTPPTKTEQKSGT